MNFWGLLGYCYHMAPDLLPWKQAISILKIAELKTHDIRLKRALSRFARLEKLSLNISSSSFAIRAILILCFFMNFSVFFYLTEPLFSGFLQFKGKCIRGQDNSTRDRTPLIFWYILKRSYEFLSFLRRERSTIIFTRNIRKHEIVQKWTERQINLWLDLNY